MSNLDDTIATYGPLARDVAAQTGLDASTVLGIIAHENVAGGHNNPFGISPGGRVASYPNIETGAQAFVDLINSRYKGATTGDNPDVQAIGLQTRGYNPNPGYGPMIADQAAALRKAGFDAKANVEPASANVSTGKSYSTDDLLQMGPKAPSASPPASNSNQPAEQPAQTPPGSYSTDDLLKMGPKPSAAPAPSTASPVASPSGITTDQGKPVYSAQGTYSGKADMMPQPSAPAPQPSTTDALKSGSHGPILDAIDRWISPVLDAPGRAAGGAIEGLSELPGKIWQGAKSGFMGTQLLTPQAQTYLDQNAPTAGAVTHVIGPVVGGVGGALSGAFEGGLNTIAKAGNAVAPGLGDAAASIAEYEGIRSMASPKIGEVPFVRENAGATTRIGIPSPNAPKPPEQPTTGTFDTLKPVDRGTALDERNKSVQPNALPDKSDNTQYVPGTQPPLAQRAPSTDNVAQYQVLKKTDPGQTLGAVQDMDNDARVQHAYQPQHDAQGNRVSGADISGGTEATLRANRAAQADKDLANAFDPTLARKVDAQPVVDFIHDQLQPDQFGNRPAVSGPLQSVLDRLYKPAETTQVPIQDIHGNPMYDSNPGNMKPGDTWQWRPSDPQAQARMAQNLPPGAKLTALPVEIMSNVVKGKDGETYVRVREPDTGATLVKPTSELSRPMTRTVQAAPQLIDDPKTLYTVRQSINDMLDRSNPNNAANIQAAKQLHDVGEELDKVIQPGTAEPSAKKTLGDVRDAVAARHGMTPDAVDKAPEAWRQQQFVNTLADGLVKANGDAIKGMPPALKQRIIDSAKRVAQKIYDNGTKADTSYDTYKANYAKASEPINEIAALKGAGYGDMTNGTGTMTRAGVQNVIDNLIAGVKSGDRDALAVKDPTWNTLFNLRDDLARKEGLITPSGNIRSTALAGTGPKVQELQRKASPSLIARGLGMLGTTGANFGLNALVHGGFSPLAATIADIGVNQAGRRFSDAAYRRANERVLNNWIQQQTALHPEWTGGGELPQRPIISPGQLNAIKLATGSGENRKRSQ